MDTQMDNIGNITDSMKIIPLPSQRKKALMLRAGGLGDIVILTPVAKALHARGYDVDFFCGSPTGAVYKLIQGLEYFHDVKEISRINGIDCIKHGENTFISVEILKGGYDEVFDFKFSVEDNTSGLNKREGWRNTLNSNFQNWVDLSLSWAKIDWTKIDSEEKRPELKHTQSREDYEDWLASSPVGSKDGRDYKVIGVQLQASSLIRSWYRAQELPDIIHSTYPEDVVLIFVNSRWIAISKAGQAEIKFPDNLDPLICSMYLVESMDAFICADSGMSHVAEAVGTQTIAIYTSVPAWTRTKYYKYAHPIEATVHCSPCFTLDAVCPIEKKRALDELSDRERDIMESSLKGIDVNVVAKKYNTIPNALVGEAQAIAQKIQARSAAMPACVAEITPEMIMDKLAQVLGQVA